MTTLSMFPVRKGWIISGYSPIKLIFGYSRKNNVFVFEHSWCVQCAYMSLLSCGLIRSVRLSPESHYNSYSKQTLAKVLILY